MAGGDFTLSLGNDVESDERGQQKDMNIFLCVVEEHAFLVTLSHWQAF